MKSYWLLTIILIAVDLGILYVALQSKEGILAWRVYDHPLAWLGLVPLLVGIGFIISGMRSLTLPIAMGVPEIMPSAVKTELVTKDLFRFFRHPCYLALILQVIGLAVITGLGIMYLLLIYFIPAMLVAARAEEKELVDRFGDVYIRYRQTTGGFWPRR